MDTKRIYIVKTSVIYFVVSEILGECFYLQDAIKLSEKADAINR